MCKSLLLMVDEIFLMSSRRLFQTLLTVLDRSLSQFVMLRTLLFGLTPPQATSHSTMLITSCVHLFRSLGQVTYGVCIFPHIYLLLLGACFIGVSPLRIFCSFMANPWLIDAIFVRVIRRRLITYSSRALLGLRPGGLFVGYLLFLSGPLLRLWTCGYLLLVDPFVLKSFSYGLHLCYTRGILFCTLATC